MAVAWALHKTHHFTLCNEKLTVLMDHKPLLKILGDKELADIDNPRILNLKQKTLRLIIGVEHMPGKDHHVADAMSPFPVGKPMGDKSWRPWEPRSCRPAKNADEVEQATKAAVQAELCYSLTTPEQSTTAEANMATSQPRMLDTKVINKELSKDPATKELKQLVEGSARKEAEDWPQVLREYFVKHAYHIMIDNTVLTDCRDIVSGGFRSQMLSALHRSHGGVEGMKARAKDAMFRPGLNADIQRAQDEC